MQNIDQMTLGQLKEFASQIPGAETFLDNLFCDSYEDFIETLYKDLDKSISVLEDARNLTSNDSEDRINADIVGKLKCMGYDATHDTQVGGHCDIHVERKNYRWIGEAKIYKGNSYLNEGFLQLTTRYTTARVNQNQGGLLIYIRRENAEEIMSNWKAEIEKIHKNDINKIDTDPKNPLAFFSDHKHKTSGCTYRTRHIPVMLHFEPQDRSARNSKGKRGN